MKVFVLVSPRLSRLPSQHEAAVSGGREGRRGAEGREEREPEGTTIGQKRGKEAVDRSRGGKRRREGEGEGG